MIRFIRSLLFDLLFYSYSFAFLIVFLPSMILPRAAVFWVARLWVKTTMRLLKGVVGLSYHVEGLEHLPTGPYIVASKHQSAWETLIFHVLLRHPAYALKRELVWIPVLNLYFIRLGMVIINRGAGARALKNLLADARKIMEQGRPLIIFPEGTRGLPGKPGNYHGGIGFLYQDLGVPVIPVALNSGLFWGRRSLLKHPGQIRIKFLPPILPGLPRAQFMEKLASSIDTACQQLEGKKFTKE